MIDLCLDSFLVALYDTLISYTHFLIRHYTIIHKKCMFFKNIHVCIIYLTCFCVCGASGALLTMKMYFFCSYKYGMVNEHDAYLSQFLHL